MGCPHQFLATATLIAVIITRKRIHVVSLGPSHQNLNNRVYQTQPSLISWYKIISPVLFSVLLLLIDQLAIWLNNPRAPDHGDLLWSSERGGRSGHLTPEIVWGWATLGDCSRRAGASGVKPDGSAHYVRSGPVLDSRSPYGSSYSPLSAEKFFRSANVGSGLGRPR
jgi:hypothetical protein